LQDWQSLIAMKKCSDRFDNLPVPRILFKDLVCKALLEDIGEGDITTRSCVDRKSKAVAWIVAKEDGLLAGLFVAKEVFCQVDRHLTFVDGLEEGHAFVKGDTLLTIEGRASSILMAERVALNFLQRLCGIATLTRKYAQKLEGSACRIVGTRKTTPGLRCLEKYAVRIGGGFNHRFCLSDGILIKDNHIAACGSVTEAISRARKHAPHTLKIEIEVAGFEELKEAIEAGADVIMLDNMTVEQLKEAVAFARFRRPHIVLEASGGVTLENVKEIAATGVDIVSSGALTHSYKSIDLSLKLNILKE